MFCFFATHFIVDINSYYYRGNNHIQNNSRIVIGFNVRSFNDDQDSKYKKNGNGDNTFHIHRQKHDEKSTYNNSLQDHKIIIFRAQFTIFFKLLRKLPKELWLDQQEYEISYQQC